MSDVYSLNSMAFSGLQMVKSAEIIINKIQFPAHELNNMLYKHKDLF